MKSIFFSLLLFVSVQHVFSQISATTSSGKKVMLNLNGTWKYTNAEDREPPCVQKHLGKVKITNNTDNDIYFYFSSDFNYLYNNIQYYKIKAMSNRIIEDLYTVRGTPGAIKINNYKWKTSYELFQGINNSTYLSEIAGFEYGNYVLNDCEIKEIIIEK